MASKKKGKSTKKKYVEVTGTFYVESTDTDELRDVISTLSEAKGNIFNEPAAVHDKVEVTGIIEL